MFSSALYAPLTPTTMRAGIKITEKNVIIINGWRRHLRQICHLYYLLSNSYWFLCRWQRDFNRFERKRKNLSKLHFCHKGTWQDPFRSLNWLQIGLFWKLNEKMFKMFLTCYEKADFFVHLFSENLMFLRVTRKIKLYWSMVHLFTAIQKCFLQFLNVSSCSG
jgi:hypothetical protein